VANLLQSVGLFTQTRGTKRMGFEALPGARNYRSCTKASRACFATRAEGPSCRRCRRARVGRVVELMLRKPPGGGDALGRSRDGRGHRRIAALRV
jgi:hypothetical protein